MRSLAAIALIGACSSSSPAPEPHATGDADGPQAIERLPKTDSTSNAEKGETGKPSVTKEKRRRSKRTTYVSDRERIDALGPLTGLDATERVAFSPSDFESLPLPAAGEWLAEHPERGQSYPEFVQGKHIRPDETRDTLYIQPLGGLVASGAPAGSELVRFCETYFGIKTKLLKPINPRKLGLTWRKRTRGEQLHAGSVLEMLKKRLPDDAFLMIAVTGHDLYPADDWNFVFGIATFRERVGVYSTARYNPTFYDVKVAMPGFETIVLRRTLNIMAHEIGHMYGLEHCVHYQCAMNGSNSLAETDRSPIHLCPVCLRKLRRGAGFDIVKRYEALGSYYKSRELDEEASWLEHHLERFKENKNE